ncbi:hypothetical protein RISK_002707 [Rhodopirellula islandica]|uniref:Uncharacterized protein n=1 Tax=Rhodopirellula islandica TaxID=595434 RepID=A0A0J1BFD2_RHOIS|nr:hypothetical protein RISK_002707 [Rhodopirellula islandica]
MEQSSSASTRQVGRIKEQGDAAPASPCQLPEQRFAWSGRHGNMGSTPIKPAPLVLP